MWNVSSSEGIERMRFILSSKPGKERSGTGAEACTKSRRSPSQRTERKSGHVKERCAKKAALDCLGKSGSGSGVVSSLKRDSPLKKGEKQIDHRFLPRTRRVSMTHSARKTNMRRYLRCVGDAEIIHLLCHSQLTLDSFISFEMNKVSVGHSTAARIN